MIPRSGRRRRRRSTAPIDASPKSKVELEVAEDSSLVAVDGLEAAWLPGCEARAANANATNPATAVTPIARRAILSRRRASSIRDGCVMRPSSTTVT